MKHLIEELINIGCLKFGDFTLKSGQKSPLYCDLRVLISYPHFMTEISDSLFAKYEKIFDAKYGERICGVPYTALPIATHYSIKHSIPMVLRRKEAKNYGTKKLLEGIFKPGEECLIVEDVVTTGSSVAETAEVLRSEGLVVKDAIVFIDRQQGATETLAKTGIRVISLITMEDIVDYVSSSSTFKLPTEQLKILQDFVSLKKVVSIENEKVADLLAKRIEGFKCDHNKKLLQIIVEKKTNLCLSADLTSCENVLRMIDQVGPFICAVKTHVDILEDIFTFGAEKFIANILELSKKHNFLVIEDRKFSDIGNTFKLQLMNGPFSISRWADFVTAHAISGSGMIQALHAEKSSLGVAVPSLIFVAQMSSSNNLITDDYTKKTIELSAQIPNLVSGFVFRKKDLFTADTEQFLKFMPGVSLEESTDGGDQNYVTVEQAITQQLADVIIVGRAIVKSDTPIGIAQQFQEKSWKSFSQRYADL